MTQAITPIHFSKRINTATQLWYIWRDFVKRLMSNIRSIGFLFHSSDSATGIFANKYLSSNRTSNATVKNTCGSKYNRIIWNAIPLFFLQNTSNLKGLSFNADVEKKCGIVI